SGPEGTLLTFTVSAADPDGEAIGALVASLSGLPAGHNASFVANPSRTAGTFQWTPTFADSGAYTVSFTAANALGGTAAITVHVDHVDRRPSLSVAAATSVNQGQPLGLVVSA